MPSSVARAAESAVPSIKFLAATSIGSRSELTVLWKVARRKVVYDSTGSHPSTSHLRKLVGVLGRRDKSDPVYDNIESAPE